MNKGWKRLKLGEIADINKNTITKDYNYNKIEYIDISSVGTGILNDTKNYDLENAPSRAKRIVKNKDTIISTVRPNRRSFLFIKNPKPNLIVSTGFAVLNARENVNSKFLYYLINDQKFTDYLTNHAKGAAYPAVDTEIIKNAEITLPPLITQKKIVSILSAYDDLIENNNRRIKILEEMAQLIYKEWFVKFKYPGHENDRMVDSELGKIPEGWAVKKLGDICEIGRGSSPRPINDKKYFEKGDIPWIKIADATRSGKFLYETKEKVNQYGASFSRKLEKGSLIIGTSGTLGYCQFLGIEGCIHDGWLYINSTKDIGLSFLYHVIISKRRYFENLAYGAAIQNINTGILKNTKFLLPKPIILNRFTKIAKLFDSQIDYISRENVCLKKIRDLLLSKLISGIIDISAL